MPWYGWLVILALIALAVVYVVVKAKKAVRNFSRQAFGTNTIAEGLRQQKEMLAQKYYFEEDGDVQRFCTSWATTQAEVDALTADIAGL